MIKTAVMFDTSNGSVSVGGRMDVEWPDGGPDMNKEYFAAIKDASGGKLGFDEIVGPDVVKFCRNMEMMELRSRLQMYEGPYIFDTEEKLDDSVLVSFFKWVRKNDPERLRKARF